MLVGIYSIENDIMDVINAFHIENTQEGRNKKQKVMEVEPARVDREEREITKKNLHSRNPKRVTFENEETPNEYLLRLVLMRLSLLAKRKNKINTKE
jgi:hypothetical protein